MVFCRRKTRGVKEMKILAIESSGMVASVAVLTDDVLQAEYTVNFRKTHSQTLLPMLDTMGAMVELQMDSVDAIAVSGGPGSFTGLRIGAATAKGLGLAVNKPLIAVPTVDSIAYNLYDTDGIICPMMDARRQQVYTGLYRFEEHRMITVMEQVPMGVDELIGILNDTNEQVTFLGDGVPVYKEKILGQMRAPYSFAPAHLNRQRAGAVAALGMQYFAEGKTVSAEEFRPDYLRVSQAERERMQKLKENPASKQNSAGI